MPHDLDYLIWLESPIGSTSELEGARGEQVMDVRVFIEPQQGATYEDQLRVALAGEGAGFDGFFRSDHYLAMGENYRRGIGPTDSWVTLGAIARETSRLRLGTLMTSATFRYPGALAVSVAQCDEMSNGRVELGIGAGWFPEEHTAYGIPFGESFGERFDRLEEQLAILTGMWSTPVGSSFSFSGRYFKLIDCPALPKPRQDPLSIIIGGKGLHRTPAIAARYAHEFNLSFLALERAAEQLSRVDEACRQIRRDPMSLLRSVVLTTVVGENEARYRARASAIGRDVDELRAGGLIGTPDEVSERLAAYGRLGVKRVYLQLLDLADLAQIEFIGKELIPLVADV